MFLRKLPKMANDVGRMWIGVAVAATGVVIAVGGDDLKAGAPAADALTGALTQLGVLYVIAVFVERALEVFIKAWRQSGRSVLENELATLEVGHPELAAKRRELDDYRAGTRRRALLTGLSIGVVLSLAGVRTLAVIVEPPSGGLQGFLFQFSDVLVTGGLVAGGSAAVHEMMSLITRALSSRKEALGP